MMNTAGNLKTHKDSMEEVKVAVYGRVSTQHEEQMNALENQIQWYRDLLKYHPNWSLVQEYVDRGLTGTNTRKRPSFTQMITDARAGRYELLVTREVSRFARNTVDSLSYTRELKKLGVEVYFVNDGLWTFDPDSEIRIAIMSALAQDEARKISERVLAGQEISRQNHQIYGSGNILGYHLVRREAPKSNTYAIDEEDAETVRIIFDRYVNQGMGMKLIAGELIALHRLNAKGAIEWDVTRVSRILSNRTYAGYIGYKKSRVKDFFEHTRCKTDESEIEYVKGDFPAIVSDEDWQKAQKIKARHVTGDASSRRGKKEARDIWVRKLTCSCGKGYKRYKWKLLQSGEIVYGYQCVNQVANKKRAYHVAHGLSGEGLCDVPSICRWKLDFMLRNILEMVWKNPEGTIEALMSAIDECYTEVAENEQGNEAGRLQREKSRVEIRQKNLLEMRLNGEIDGGAYLKAKTELDEKLESLTDRLNGLTGRDEMPTELTDRDTILEGIREALADSASLDRKFLDEALIERVVARVVPYEGYTYKWYLNFTGEETDELFCEENYVQHITRVFTFEEAKAYRRRYGNFIRQSQWHDMTAVVYLRA